jgi:hypothetical protein
MRRAATWVVIAAVGAIALAAAVDAVREPGPREAASRPNSERRAAIAALRAAGLRGVLTYSDSDCRLHGVTLPDLEPHPAPNGPACVFGFSGGRPAIGDAVRHPTDPVLEARCRPPGVVEISHALGRIRARGCTPTWKPNGILTAVRDGEVVELHLDLERGVAVPRLVLARRTLLRAMPRAARVFGRPIVQEVAWLTSERFAVVASTVAPGLEDEVLAVFERGRRIGPAWCCHHTLSGLRVSPRGRFVAATSERGLVVLARDGRGGALPVQGHAIAWSEDESWAAVAKDGGIAFFSPRDGVTLPVDVPIAARDLIWA